VARKSVRAIRLGEQSPLHSEGRLMKQIVKDVLIGSGFVTLVVLILF
jgi:hypothetical protein